MLSKLLYWIPRILALISILFMAMFSLDAFDGGESLGTKMLGFFIHNIPVLILIAILIVAWKHELAGGILYVAASAFGTFFFHSFSGNPGSLVVIAPFLVTGVLFILHIILYPSTKTE